MPAKNAGQKAAGHRQRDESSLLLDHQISDGRFGRLLLFVPEHDIVTIAARGVSRFVDGAARRLVVKEHVSGVDGPVGKFQSQRTRRTRDR